MQFVHTVVPTVIICKTDLPPHPKKHIMNEEKPQSVMGESNCPQRRRSARLSSPQTSVDKMAPLAAVKRSIVVKKIAPRKTTLPKERNKENVPRLSDISQQEKAPTPGPVRALSPKPTMPSPILASPSPPHLKTAADPEDLVWSQKVRRSYSRLSDQSFNSPRSRETLFGFAQLNTPEVVRNVERSKRGVDVSGSVSGLSSFTSLLEGDDSALPLDEPVFDIPGIAMVKVKRRRKKVQQMNLPELDTLSAKMNAEFEEAEGFELVVE